MFLQRSSAALFEEVAAFANLHLAYLKARRAKRYRASILKFGCGLEENLLTLRRELLDATYRHGGYREFVVIDSKKRVIKAAPFRDRVLHHALCNVIEPTLDKGFIYDSYACRVGKGTHAAVRRLASFIRSLHTRERERERVNPGRIYCLKCDISKYFDSIDHEVLYEILSGKIKDEGVLQLIREILVSHPKGIPIGNLTSQLFANVYLNELDHFVKRTLKEKYYIRYMDDFIVLGPDKKRLHETKEKIREFLRSRLKLELHPKKAEVSPVDKGVDFLGYVVRGNRRLLRKSTVRRFLRKRKRQPASPQVLASWRGYAKFADSYRLMRSLGLTEK